jgi:hypothetical protein
LDCISTTNLADQQTYYNFPILVGVSPVVITVYFFPDIDECSRNPCHNNANCTDHEGSFECHCNIGFSGNGLNCTSRDNFHTSRFVFLTDSNGLLNVFYS